MLIEESSMMKDWPDLVHLWKIVIFYEEEVVLWEANMR